MVSKRYDNHYKLIDGKHILYFEWYKTLVNGQVAVVVKERESTGPSLTNRMESVIDVLVKEYDYNILVFQDCKEEGIFKVDYEYWIYARSPKWTYFAKDLKAFNLLYGQKV